MKNVRRFAVWVLAATLWAESDLAVVLDPLPGVYSSSQILRVEAGEGLDVRYRFLEDSDPAYLPWSDALELSVLPGEHRDYQLRVQTTNAAGESLVRDYRYSLQAPAPILPAVRPSPGLFAGPVVVQATLPPGFEVLLDDVPVSFPLRLEGLAGELKTYRLEPKGPSASSLPVWTYALDLRGQAAVSLEILSPKAGNWLNRQTLVLAFQGLEQVSWSWGTVFDPKTAVEYTRPVFLDRTGPLAVTVSGKTKGTGQLITRTLSWENGSMRLEDWKLPEAGALRTTLEFPADSAREFSFDEGKTWRSAASARREAPFADALRILSLQYRLVGKESAARAVYWLDSRTPSVPLLDYWGGWNPRVSFSGNSDGWYTVEWTAANGTKTLSSGQWGPSGSWKIPDGMQSAKLKAVLANGSSAESAVQTFPETGWVRPVWEPWDARGLLQNKTSVPLGGRLLPRPGFQVAYEISSDPAVREPDAGSPVLSGPLLPQMPRGADRQLYVRFAWRDESGLVGPSTPAIAVRIDRKAPSVPLVSVSNGKLVLSSTDLDSGMVMSYALTPQKLRSAEAVAFVNYQGPVDVTALASTSPWLHVFAQDPAGNLSDVGLNVPLEGGAAGSEWKGLVQVAAGGTPETALENGAVLGQTRVAVAPSVAGDATVWWQETSDNNLPETWEARMQKVTSPLLFGIAAGDRKTFYTWWNLKTSKGWVWEKPRVSTFTLDQGFPKPPVFENATPGAFLSEAWVVKGRPGQTGDSLFYALSRDGTEPGDPLGPEGLAWPGTLVLDVGEGETGTFRLRLGSKSVAGMAKESAAVPLVTIDKSVPKRLPVTWQPFTYRTQPWLLTLPVTSPVRYTVTKDGSLPALPDARSSEVDGGLLRLEGAEGVQTLYRVRLRPFSASSQPGPATEAFTVLIDRTAGLSLPLAEAAISAEKSSFSVTGFPENGFTSEAVTLGLSTPWGRLRYELTEGSQTTRSVDAVSPLFPGTLTLEGSPGADRLYTLGVRSFSDDGSPLSPEARWTLRIDRSPPPSPVLTLTPDSRRPEAVVGVKASLEDGDVLVYRWKWSVFPEGEGSQDWKVVDGSEMRFVAPQSQLTRLTVEALVRDAAGNPSPSTVSEILLDRNVVYLSASAKGSGAGTRENPALSLAAAYDKMRQEGRRILLVTSGLYSLSRVQDWTGFSVWGGLQEGKWEATAAWGRSTLSATKDHRGPALVESYGGKLELHRIDLQVESESLKTVFRVENSVVEVDQATWLNRLVPVLWQQTGGSLAVSAVAALVENTVEGSVFRLNGTDFRFRELRLSSQNNRDVRLVSLNSSQGLLAGISSVSRREAGLNTFLWASQSRIVGTNLKVILGEGASWATALALTGTSAELTNVDLGLYADRGNTGIQTQDGDLDLKKLNLRVYSGVEFNQGISAGESRLQLLDGAIQIDSGSYQGGISQVGGSMDLRSYRIGLAGGTKKAWGLQTLEDCLNRVSDVTWVRDKKSDGNAIIRLRPWLEGSTESNSVLNGW